MAILNIYSLNDTENQNVIASLPEGTHTIGRGDLLQVTDKRVSRKHAVIEVTSDKIYLTSVHVNPCFFKAFKGKTLTVLSQNQQSELHDGDHFALLPESCWFKVTVDKEDLADEPPNGLGDFVAESNGKRHHENNLEDNDVDSESKRARLSATSHKTSISNEDNIAPTSNITLQINNIPNDASQNHEKLSEPVTESNVNESNTSLNVAETIKTEPNENIDVEIKKEAGEQEEEIAGSSSNALNTVNNANTSNTAIKEEPLNNTNNGGDSSSNALNTVNNANTSNTEIKEEPLDNGNNGGDTGENNVSTTNNDTSNEPNPEVRTENDDADNQSKNGASGSGTGPKKVYRERCWYGDRCFRKNPNHRETFAHPGDQDYDPDPDDDRPDCPYGATCYRKNVEHRRDYKHTGKPAPKPRPASPGSPTTRNDPPTRKKPRKAATKTPKPKGYVDSSEDDYDVEDPFINDGSSDDFQPSDDIDSDSDWEDSQEVEESQERRRMLKEAKKFTRKGKK